MHDHSRVADWNSLSRSVYDHQGVSIWRSEVPKELPYTNSMQHIAQSWFRPLYPRHHLAVLREAGERVARVALKLRELEIQLPALGLPALRGDVPDPATLPS